ncbi:MAG: hypothetical protein IPP29_09935 [Bacteroidetes bacterium]|nr:hypothetical protein [Bacteroidota bacterium]
MILNYLLTSKNNLLWKSTAYINDKIRSKRWRYNLEIVRFLVMILFHIMDAPNLDPYGSWRVCSVDVALVQNGNAKLASCHTGYRKFVYLYR